MPYTLCVYYSRTGNTRRVMQEVAQELYTSPASMIRFCKKLGFSGFSEFKAALKLELSKAKQEIFKLQSQAKK